MARFACIIVALSATASAFAPAAPAVAVATTKMHGYVPAGLTEAEYKASQDAAKKKVEEGKKKFKNQKAFLDVGDYLLNLEKDQTFKGGAFKASGHTYAKQKFETKEEFDEAAKKKKGFFGRG
eukprot:CAMPEP_0184081166 /NCGR_PEP_ID=MMETSP0974-20121125/2567_1 /TAXON_ID=483370 /ORGANISM="non described non described, Strain CCMP2097" /LENGTH=122 /DNA_ID=CAMNT_0026383835 /DNA_START=85 /DNA_END=453 /DNA_ORIENTATION=-